MLWTSVACQVAITDSRNMKVEGFAALYALNSTNRVGSVRVYMRREGLQNPTRLRELLIFIDLCFTRYEKPDSEFAILQCVQEVIDGPDPSLCDLSAVSQVRADAQGDFATAYELRASITVVAPPVERRTS